MAITKRDYRLGRKIQRLRKQKGLTQEKLAEEAKVDPKTIIQMETGKRNPTLKTLQKIANALKISVDQILKKP